MVLQKNYTITENVSAPIQNVLYTVFKVFLNSLL